VNRVLSLPLVFATKLPTIFIHFCARAMAVGVAGVAVAAAAVPMLLLAAEHLPS